MHYQWNGLEGMPAFGLIYEGPDSGFPSLDITVTPDTAAYTIVYSGTGTVTASVNGGSFTTPQASPWVVTRQSSQDIVIIFKSTYNGQSVTQTVTVPASGFSTSNLSLTYRFDPIHGYYVCEVSFTATEGYDHFNVYRSGYQFSADSSIGEVYNPTVNAVVEPDNLLVFRPLPYTIVPDYGSTFVVAIWVNFYDANDNLLGESPVLDFNIPGY
jgi:hypothetical protein